MIIRYTTCKINEIHSEGCREGPSKVTKIMKFMKTAKFMIIRHTTYKIKKCIQRIAGKAHRKSQKLRNLQKLQNLR